jgi:DNA-binding NarL/FixJ family response regulator
MGTTKRLSILIIEPSAPFREELCNFLFSAGYERVEAADDWPDILDDAFDKACQPAYDVIIADASSPAVRGVERAQSLAQFHPGMKIILMIGVEEQQIWSRLTASSSGVHFLLKTTFAQNLLYLLEEPP